jgi:hypothetical protein
MISLDKNDFHKVMEPLKTVTVNNLFARSVVEKRVSGKIYVDNTENPKTFYVIHPYGMTLLFGNCSNIEFNNKFKNYALNVNNIRGKNEWMQVFPDEWNNVLPKLFGDSLVKSEDNNERKDVIVLDKRVNFMFSQEKFLQREKYINSFIKIIRTDDKIFDNMHGLVVPKYFWDNKEDFMKNGVGFSLFYNSELASTAYSSYIHDNKLELGIETIEKFRKMGLAEIVCGALIEYCIENSYEPIWSCRLSNIGSYKLAEKLGFEPILNTPYYLFNIK